MSEEESTDAAGDEANAEESEKGSSLDPWPEIERDTERRGSDDEPTTSDQTSHVNETDTARQGDESTGAGDDQNHGCDHDNAIPCRFQ